MILPSTFPNSFEFQRINQAIINILVHEGLVEYDENPGEALMCQAKERVLELVKAEIGQSTYNFKDSPSGKEIRFKRFNLYWRLKTPPELQHIQFSVVGSLNTSLVRHGRQLLNSKIPH